MCLRHGQKPKIKNKTKKKKKPKCRLRSLADSRDERKNSMGTEAYGAEEVKAWS